MERAERELGMLAYITAHSGHPQQALRLTEHASALARRRGPMLRYDRADPPQDNPGDYAPPHGLFLLLFLDNQPAGCGGYRIHDPTTGEIKRLYVRPEHRGQGHGRRILTTLEHHAPTIGSTYLLLETGARNEAAIALFTSTGYTPTPGYVPHRDHRINRAFTTSLPVPQQGGLRPS